MPKVDTAWMQSVGPPWDTVCGTDGESTDLNALVTAGHKRILLAEGAVLTANLVLSNPNGFLWSPFDRRALNLGAYTITLNSYAWTLAGFMINGAAGAGLVLSTLANRVTVERLAIESCGSHGINSDNTYGENNIFNCHIRSNGGDGVRFKASAAVNWLRDCHITNNTGYGLNDLSNNSIAIGNELYPNTAGALSGTPAVDLGNIKT